MVAKYLLSTVPMIIKNKYSKVLRGLKHSKLCLSGLKVNYNFFRIGSIHDIKF